MTSKSKIKGKGFRTDRLTHKVKQIIQTHGDKQIIGARIARTPVLEMWKTLFHILTFGEFTRRLEATPYDKLFHLRLDVELDDFSVIGIEKLDIINMDRDPKITETTEVKQITKLPTGLTIKTLMEKTHDHMGAKFYTYSASKNNCQDFAKAILDSNGIGDASDIEFIKQDVKSLFKDLTFLRKFSNTATDLTAFIKMLLDNIPYNKQEQVELLKLQENTEPNYIEGQGMVSNTELEAKIRAILKDLLKESSLTPSVGTVKKAKAKAKKTVTRKPRLVKGSPEAKEYMAKLRAMRKKV